MPLSEQSTNQNQLPESPVGASGSPRSSCSSRTFKGESIRSLRGLLQASLSSRSLPDKQQTIEDEPTTEEPDEKQQIEEAEVDAADAEKRKQEEVSGARRRDKARHADEVRSRLLQNLGIQKQVESSDNAPPPVTTAQKKNSESWGPSYEIPLNDDDNTEVITTTTEKNNNEDDEDAHTTSTITNATTAATTASVATVISEQTTTDTTTTTTTTTNSNDDDSNNKKKKSSHLHHIQFHPIVTVHPIPSHKVYSDRIRQTIWTGSYELEENVARNSLEFSYEYWDPDKVLDEDTGLVYYRHQQQQQGGGGQPPAIITGEWIHPVHFGQEPPPLEEDEEVIISEEEMWKQTCERLGIQPAEYYHSFSPAPSQESTTTATTNNHNKK